MILIPSIAFKVIQPVVNSLNKFAGRSHFLFESEFLRDRLKIALEWVFLVLDVTGQYQYIPLRFFELLDLGERELDNQL
jgi:hypothetical protein